jgi:hypothetical protein
MAVILVQVRMRLSLGGKLKLLQNLLKFMQMQPLFSPLLSLKPSINHFIKRMTQPILENF